MRQAPNAARSAKPNTPFWCFDGAVIAQPCSRGEGSSFTGRSGVASSPGSGWSVRSSRRTSKPFARTRSVSSAKSGSVIAGLRRYPEVVARRVADRGVAYSGSMSTIRSRRRSPRSRARALRALGIGDDRTGGDASHGAVERAFATLAVDVELGLRVQPIDGDGASAVRLRRARKLRDLVPAPLRRARDRPSPRSSGRCSVQPRARSAIPTTPNLIAASLRNLPNESNGVPARTMTKRWRIRDRTARTAESAAAFGGNVLPESERRNCALSLGVRRCVSKSTCTMP